MNCQEPMRNIVTSSYWMRTLFGMRLSGWDGDASKPSIPRPLSRDVSFHSPRRELLGYINVTGHFGLIPWDGRGCCPPVKLLPCSNTDVRVGCLLLWYQSHWGLSPGARLEDKRCTTTEPWFQRPLSSPSMTEAININNALCKYIHSNSVFGFRLPILIIFVIFFHYFTVL